MVAPAPGARRQRLPALVTSDVPVMLDETLKSRRFNLSSATREICLFLDIRRFCTHLLKLESVVPLEMGHYCPVSEIAERNSTLSSAK
jgi:hypothetical protein